MLSPNALREWLVAQHAFAFTGQCGHLSLLKEQRPGGGAGYWYAYRRHGARTLKRYAGRSSSLTFARLEQLAAQLGDAGPDPLVPQPAAVEAAAREPLLVSKLQPPRLRRSLVDRPRLIARLDAGRSGKLTVVAAPAGFGKTTLVRQWLAALDQLSPDRRPAVAWLSLDADDSDPGQFWRYLITAAQAFGAPVGRDSLQQLDASLALRSGLRPVLTAFVNELAHIRTDGVLVLEDYHAVASEAVHSGLAFALEHLPPRVHVVLLSRIAPPLGLARLRATGELTEIEVTELRFSAAETSSVLRHTSGTALTERQIARIDSRIEGWAAGLRLLTLALHSERQPSAIERILANFESQPRLLTDYFVSEVLQSLPPRLQEFVLQTSFLDRLNPSLCDAVCQGDGSASALAELEARNVFLESLDGPGGWHRYHALFASAMHSHARLQLGNTGMNELFGRASDWFAAAGMQPEAIDAAFGAGQTARAVELIEALLARHYDTEYQETPVPPQMHAMGRWLPQVPAHILEERPLLSFGLASSLFFQPLLALRPISSVPVEAIERLLTNAQRGFEATRDSAYLGRCMAFRAMLAQHRGSVLPGGAWAQAALALLPKTDLAWRNICLCCVGLAEMHAGDVVQAAARFAEARASCEPPRLQPFARVSTGLLAWAELELGEFARAEELFRNMLAAARQQNDLEDIGHGLHGLAEISLWRNDLDAAWTHAREVLRVAEDYPHVQFYCGAALVLAQVELARGRVDSALERCAALLTERPADDGRVEQHVRAEIVFQQASIALSAGVDAIAREWRQRRQADPQRERLQLDREELLVARIYLADGDTSSAVTIAENVLESAAAGGRRRIVGEAQGVLDTARAALRQPLLDTLSAREAEVLRLLAAGSANAEIADELVVSVNTVKAHVKSVYRKLGVTSRLAAAEAARELQLI